jgi:hypothetical protein
VTVINASDKVFFNIAAPRILAKRNAIKLEVYLLDINNVLGRYPSGSFAFVNGRATFIDVAPCSVAVEGRTSRTVCNLELEDLE